MVTIGDTVTVTIDSLSLGESGVTRLVDKEKEKTFSLFVPKTAPQDVLEVEIVSKKKRYFQGECKNIIKPSPIRQKVTCPYFFHCGGCDWLHIKYDEQKKQKEQQLSYILKQANKLSIKGITEIVGSDKTKNYRKKCVMHGVIDKSKVSIGYYARGTHNLLDISYCEMVASPINELLERVREIFSKELPKFSTTFQFEVRCNETNRNCIVIFSIDPQFKNYFRKQAVTLFKKEKNRIGKIILVDTCNGKKLDAIEHTNNDHYLFYSLDDIRPLILYFGWRSFTQINMDQNKELISTVKDLVKLRKHDSVLDMFCGIGNFALPLSLHCKEMTGIDASKTGIEWAKENAKRNRLENVTFICGDAKAEIEQLKSKNEAFDIVISDPPRVGLENVLPELLDLCKKRFIYVSCNPRSLGRDLKYCVENGFSIKEVVPIDMFPNTYHIESVTLLTRNK